MASKELPFCTVDGEIEAEVICGSATVGSSAAAITGNMCSSRTAVNKNAAKERVL